MSTVAEVVTGIEGTNKDAVTVRGVFKRNGRTNVFSLINSLSTGYETLRDAFTFWPITFTCPSLIPYPQNLNK